MNRALLLLVPLCVGCLDRSPYEPRFDVIAELSDKEELEYLAISEKNIWWASPTRLFRARKDTGAVVSIEGGGGNKAPLLIDDDQAFYVFGESLYALTWDEAPTEVSNDVLWSAWAGGERNDDSKGVFAMTQSQTHVYYVSETCGGACSSSAPPCVCAWPKTGGVSVVLTSGHPIWRSESEIQIAWSGGELYFSHQISDEGFQLFKIDPAAGEADWEGQAMLGTPEPIKYMLGHENKGLFGALERPAGFDGGASSSIKRLEVGGAWVELVRTAGDVLSMAFGPAHVYWIAEDGDEKGPGRRYELARVLLEGGSGERLATFGGESDSSRDITSPDLSGYAGNHFRVVADVDHVYWSVERGHSQILRLAVDP